MMGLDLTLMPIGINTNYSSGEVSLSLLKCDRDYELFKKIKAIKPQTPVSDDFMSFRPREDVQFGHTTKDPYGKRVKWVYAEDLKLCDIRGAVGAYVSALPDKYRIALYWH